MKIISMRWRNGSSDFITCAVNDDVANARYKELRKADKKGLFDIAVFQADTFQSVLEYVRHENSPKGATATKVAGITQDS